MLLTVLINGCTSNEDPTPNIQTPSTPTLDCGVDEVSYLADVKPIIEANCLINNPNCHGMNSLLPDWSNFNTVKSRANSIRTRTGNRSMPPSGGLSDDQIKLIACWVQQGAKDN